MKKKRLKTDREEGDRRSRFIFINLFSPLAGLLLPMRSNNKFQVLFFFSVPHKTSAKHQVVQSELEWAAAALIWQPTNRLLFKQSIHKTAPEIMQRAMIQYLINLISCLELYSPRMEIAQSDNFWCNFASLSLVGISRNAKRKSALSQRDCEKAIKTQNRR